MEMMGLTIILLGIAGTGFLAVRKAEQGLAGLRRQAQTRLREELDVRNHKSWEKELGA